MTRFIFSCFTRHHKNPSWYRKFKTFLHFNYHWCCSRAALKVLSRQTSRCTNNVFNRAISHMSDLGSFYQLMNTLKRLHCFPDQCHCFLARAPRRCNPSTSKWEKRCLIVDFSKFIIPSWFFFGGGDDMNVDEILSVLSERTSQVLTEFAFTL